MEDTSKADKEPEALKRDGRSCNEEGVEQQHQKEKIMEGTSQANRESWTHKRNGSNRNEDSVEQPVHEHQTGKCAR